MSDADLLIVGGGPAGMMAGLLFARAGVKTLVLEKHGDFLRDFRGDTVHPATLDLFAELGLLDGLLARPHDEAPHAHGPGRRAGLYDRRFHPSADGARLHRADAAMGVPRFHQHGGAGLSRIHAPDELRSDGLGDGRRTHRRRHHARRASISGRSW